MQHLVRTTSFAVYGLLRPGESAYRRFRLARRCRLIGPCRIPGDLYDAGGYPALVSGEGRVRADLLESRDPKLFAELDAFEDFDPKTPAKSLYLRQKVPVETDTGVVEAWVYVFNRPVAALRRIASGDWLARRIGG